MTLKSESTDEAAPLTQLKTAINNSLSHIAEEAKRAKNPSFVQEGGDIWKMFLETARALGTTRHEEAVSTLKRQLKIIKDEQRAAHRHFWQRYRTESVDLPLIDKESDILEQLIKDREIHLDTEREIDKALVRAVDAAIVADKSIKELNTGLKSIHLDILLYELRDYLALNLRLYMQRLLAFTGKHGFIVVVIICMGGYGYSTLIAHGKTLFAQLLPNPSYVGVFLISTYLFKEYVVSKWLKKLRLKWERKLLYPVLSVVFESRIKSLGERIWTCIEKIENEKQLRFTPATEKDD